MLREKSWKLQHKIFGDTGRVCGVACMEDRQGCEQFPRSPAIFSISEVAYCVRAAIYYGITARL